jgi:mannose-6-phosphate isomerase-like protein (cupin superfamily)
MRVYRETENPWRCGHWNGPPIEIGLTTSVLTRIAASEAYHYHGFHEYYVVLYGRATLCVEGKDVPLEAGLVVMVQPGERHRVVWIDPNVGARWIVIKERSVPDGKIVVPEPDERLRSDE